MKDEKKKKSKKTEPKKNGAKADKPSAKKSAAQSTDADSKSKVENVSESVSESVSKTETFDGITTPIFCLMKGTANIAVFEAEPKIIELGDNFSTRQLEQMQSGEIVLPFGDFIYSPDKAKLENIVAEKGWSDTAKPDHTIEYDEPQVNENQSASPLSPDEFGGEDFPSDFPDPATGLISGPLPEETPKDESSKDEGAKDESLDLSDPNQPIYDLLITDPAFAETLNKKETALVVALREGKKVVASFSTTDSKLFENIVSKYESYNPEPKDEIKTGDDGQESLDQFRTPEALARAEEEKKALEPDEIIQPLSADEKTEYDKLNTDFKTAKTSFDNAPFEMMRIASEVRAKKLFREEYSSMKEWAEKEHGITPKYAQNLAQFGDFRNVLSDTGRQLAGSVNSTEQWAQDTNKIAKQIGVKASDYDAMKPIIEAVESVVEEIGTDGKGNLNSVAPRIFSAANDKIPEIIHTGSIEIGGEQMRIEDALKLGEDVLTEGIKTQIVEAVAEGIKTQKSEIVEYINDSKKRRTEPHEAASTPSTNGKPVFTGVVPSYTVECTRHPDFQDNYIVNVFNAGFEFKCTCKWQKLTTSGESFVCIETDGLSVQHD